MSSSSELGYETAVSDKLIISHGPIMVYSTMSSSDKIDFKDKFVIVHGWTPLLLSTAACFTQLHCYFELPVYAPSIYRLVINSVEVKVYTKSSPNIVRTDEDSCVVEESVQSSLESAKSSLANIYLADMSNFNETIELHANTKMCIFAENVYEIVLKTGAKLHIEK